MTFQEYLETEHSDSEFVEWLESKLLLSNMEIIDDDDNLEEILGQFDCPDELIDEGLDLWDLYLDDEL